MASVQSSGHCPGQRLRAMSLGVGQKLGESDGQQCDARFSTEYNSLILGITSSLGAAEMELAGTFTKTGQVCQDRRLTVVCFSSS